MLPPINVTINICCHPHRPATPENLSLVIVLDKENNMATATANWTPSTSPDVTKQTLTFSINDQQQPPQVFNDNTTATAQMPVSPNDRVTVDLYCTSPAGDSGHVTASGTVPGGGGAGPNPPTNLNLTFSP